MANLHKWFGGVHALDDAHMIIRQPGVVHALMGQNGSGKSTMLNVLSGQLRPDSGTIELNGRQVMFRSPPDALAAGYLDGVSGDGARRASLDSREHSTGQALGPRGGRHRLAGQPG